MRRPVILLFMIRTIATCGLLALGLSVATLAAAQADQLSANDKDFVEFAGETDLVAVRLGQLAQLHASSPKVKSFALRLEREHAADLKRLALISNKTGGIAPNTLDDVHAGVVKRLSKSKGTQFDHAFLKAIVNEHENALTSFQREAEHGFNPSLQAYAKATLPKLESHIKLAKELDASE